MVHDHHNIFQLSKDNNDNNVNSTVKTSDVFKFIVLVPFPVKGKKIEVTIAT